MDVNNLPMPVQHKYPLKFLITIGSLNDLAATSLALDLWHHNFLFFYFKKRFELKQVLNVPLPRRIKEIICRSIPSVGLKLYNLHRILIDIGICTKDGRTFLKYFTDLTYGPDGEVCLERSAKNLLSRNDLTQWEKFQIACVFWMEDEIRKIWPSVFHHPDSTYGFDSTPFVRYWMAKMRNLNSNSVPDDQFNFKRMIDTAKDFQNWTAWANIFQKLFITRQRDSIQHLAKYYPRGMRNMLYKSNELQADYFLSNFPNQIIFGIVMQKGGFEYAIKIWNLVRESINVEKFFEILKSLWIDSMELEKRIFIREIQTVLLEIWTTAPKRLKKEFLRDNNYVQILFESLPEIDKIVHHCLDSDMSFVSKLFCDMPKEKRSVIWQQYWCQIIICSPTKILNELVILGLTNDDDDCNKFIEEELMNFEKSESIIRYWFKRQLYYELISYTKLCPWNRQLIREFRNQIFSTCIPELYFFRLDELIKLGVVIDNNLPNVEAKEAKRMILFSNNIQTFFKLKLNRGWAKEAICMIDKFLPTERSRLEKQLFLNHWRNFLSHNVYKFYPFDVDRWKEFLFWWIDNENDLPMFKKCFPVNEIFDEILLKAVLKLSLRLDRLNKKVLDPVPSSNCKLKEFVDVDNFLMWYFGDVKAVKRYKRNKMPNYQNISRLNNLLSINDECIVNRVIAWFFNYNSFEIRRFKKKSKKNVWVYKLYR